MCVYKKKGISTNYEMGIALQLYVSCMRRVSLVRDGNDFRNITTTTRLPSRLKHIHSCIICTGVCKRSIYMYATTLPRFYIECDLKYFYFHFVTMAALAQNTDGIARYNNGGGASARPWTVIRCNGISEFRKQVLNT